MYRKCIKNQYPTKTQESDFRKHFYTETCLSMFLKNYGKKEVVSCPSIDDLLSRQLLPSFIYSNFMFISLQLSPSNITSLIPVDLAVNLFFTFSCTFGCIVQASDLFFFFFYAQNFSMSSFIDLNVFTLVGYPAQHICYMFRDFAHLGRHFVI